MQVAEKHGDVSVEDYLAAEELSEIRHEYRGGQVYARAGETRPHNTIALNLAGLEARFTLASLLLSLPVAAVDEGL